MARRQAAIGKLRPDIFRQLQEAHRVGDVATALAQRRSEIGLRIAELGDEVVIAGRLLDRVEVGALHVLDDGELKRRLVVDIDHDDRHVGKSTRCAARQRRSPATISRPASPGTRRTTIGWISPLSRIEAASSSSSASAKARRGLRGLAAALRAGRAASWHPPSPAPDRRRPRRSGPRGRGQAWSGRVHPACSAPALRGGDRSGEEINHLIEITYGILLPRDALTRIGWSRQHGEFARMVRFLALDRWKQAADRPGCRCI